MRTHHIFIGCLVVAAGAGLAVIFQSSDPSGEPARRGAPEATANLAAPEAHTVRVPGSDLAAPTAAAETQPGSALAPSPPPLGFDEAFERIVDLYVATAVGPSPVEKAVFELEATRLYADAIASSELGERFVGRLRALIVNEPTERDAAGFLAAQHGLRVTIGRMRTGASVRQPILPHW